MTLLLKDKVAIITGGTTGIGRAIALAFVREGAHTVVWGTHPERAEKTLSLLNQEKVSLEQKIFSKLVNVAKKEEVALAIQEITSEWKNIDILVNNAGIAKDSLLMKMSEEDWDQVVSVNLKSVYNCCQPVIRLMLKARQGKIINISSVVALKGNAGQSNYAASKAGIIGFTRALAKESASRGISVNCIAPGFIQTSMTEHLNQKQKEALLQQIPMGREGKPEDVAHAALFLATPFSDYITGQVIVVDGGMAM